MNRAKYKLGTLVEFSVTGGTEYGVTDAILSFDAGFSYRLKNTEVDGKFVSETDIISAYRPIVARKVAKKATVTKATKKKATHSQENSLSS